MSSKPSLDTSTSPRNSIVQRIDLRDRLRDLIGRKVNGLVIDASDHLNALGLIEARPKAAFRLCDGSLTQQFITIWGLFRHPAMMNECLQGLADIVTALIDNKGPVDFIATCTATGSHLMGHVRARLDKLGKKIPGVFLGTYPLATEVDITQLKGKRVIFVTDVIDKANLTGSVISKLIEKQAVPIAVLAVVVTKRSDTEPVRLSIDAGGATSVPLYSLTDFTLKSLNKSQVDPAQIIDIGPGTLLNRVIADRQNGMLLGPEVSKTKENVVSFRPNIAFQLPSGILQRHFITFWPLFEKIWYFDDCMDYLAAKAKEIRLQRYYSTIVTCTATGRHLMEHLQARIETEDRPVEALYLGPYPYQALTHFSPREFDNQHILILADVIASQRLVTDIAAVVHKLGGKIAAVLGVVAIQQDEGAVINEVSYAPGATAPISYLVSFAIQRVQTSDAVGARIIKIDPETILPQEDESNGERWFQLFDYSTTLRHLDAAEAVRMGFFEGSTKLFTVGVRLPRLFDVCGLDIWKKISFVIKDRIQDFLVTTTDREDLQFLHFVQQWISMAQPDLKPLFIPRYDSIDFDFPYFLPNEDRKRLSGRCVILLVSSVQTSEKLRKLVSLLMQSEVQSICVVCLINRMGHHTADFIGRIEKMSSGVGAQSSHGNFEFHAIYPINDLGGAELRATLDSIHRLAAQYADRTGSTLFKSLVEEEMRYFRMKPFLSGHITQQSPYRFPRPMSLSGHGTELQLYTWDAGVYAIYFEAQKSRRYERLIGLIHEEADRSRLYLIFVLLLSEVTFLRLTHQDEILKNAILNAVKKKRAARMTCEDQLRRAQDDGPQELEAAYTHIFRLVQEETHLLFGLALFGYLDADSNSFLPWIWETAMSGFSDLSQWKDYPLSFQVYYGEPRILWCVSLLLHFAHIEESLSTEQFQVEAEKLKKLCRDCLNLLPNLEIKDVAKEKPEEWKRRLKYSFDSLLTDLGFHELRYKHQVLRFLRSRVSHRAPHHNAIMKDIKEAVRILTSFLHEQPEPPPPTKGVMLMPQEDETHKWKIALDKAIQASAFLDMIGLAAAELFGFYPTKDVDKTKRFLGSPKAEGFRGDVYKLQRRLSRIRAEGMVSWHDLTRISAAVDRIAKDLDIPDSALRVAVQYYNQPLLSTVIAEMESADKYMSQDYWPIWKEQTAVFRQNLANSKRDVYVLCDPLLLREILWNLFTNVRHGLPQGRPFRKRQYEKVINVELQLPDPSAPAGEELQFCELRVTSPAGKPELSADKDHTIGRHALELRQFQGQLNTQDNGNQFHATLRLIYRQDGESR